MQTVIIYGVAHKGSTFNVVQLFKDKLKIQANNLIEFFLPKDVPHFCVGCNNCFTKGEKRCPNREYITPIIEAMRSADLIIFAFPTYVAHVPGQMKVLIDHLSFQYMIHRPDKTMFTKTALIVSTAGLLGLRPAIKYMKKCLNLLGISQIFTLGVAVGGVKWEDTCKKIQPKVECISKKISKEINQVHPSFRIKGWFYLFRSIHKKGQFIPYETAYWKQQGWLGNTRPW